MSIFQYTDRRVNGQDFESGAIANVYYDRDTQRLGVEFNKGFSVYVYDDVPESVFGLFVEADSLHQFYTDYIQGRFGESKQYDAVTRREEVTSKGEDHSDVEAFAPAPVALFEPNKTLDDLIEQANNTAKYGVKWTGSFNNSDERMGPFEYLLQATSADEAIVDFNRSLANLFGTSVTVKIVSVTHYFE